MRAGKIWGVAVVVGSLAFSCSSPSVFASSNASSEPRMHHASVEAMFETYLAGPRFKNLQRFGLKREQEIINELKQEYHLREDSDPDEAREARKFLLRKSNEFLRDAPRYHRILLALEIDMHRALVYAIRRPDAPDDEAGLTLDYVQGKQPLMEYCVQRNPKFKRHLFGAFEPFLTHLIGLLKGSDSRKKRSAREVFYDSEEFYRFLAESGDTLAGEFIELVIDGGAHDEQTRPDRDQRVRVQGERF